MLSSFFRFLFNSDVTSSWNVDSNNLALPVNYSTASSGTLNSTIPQHRLQHIHTNIYNTCHYLHHAFSLGLCSFGSSGPIMPGMGMPAHLRNSGLTLNDFRQLLKSALFRTVQTGCCMHLCESFLLAVCF